MLAVSICGLVLSLAAFILTILGALRSAESAQRFEGRLRLLEATPQFVGRSKEDEPAYARRTGGPSGHAFHGHPHHIKHPGGQT